MEQNFNNNINGINNNGRPSENGVNGGQNTSHYLKNLSKNIQSKVSPPSVTNNLRNSDLISLNMASNYMSMTNTQTSALTSNSVENNGVTRNLNLDNALNTFNSSPSNVLENIGAHLLENSTNLLCTNNSNNYNHNHNNNSNGNNEITPNAFSCTNIPAQMMGVNYAPYLETNLDKLYITNDITHDLSKSENVVHSVLPNGTNYHQVAPANGMANQQPAVGTFILAGPPYVNNKFVSLESGGYICDQQQMQTQNVNPIQENGTSRTLPMEYISHSVPTNAILIDQSNNVQHLHGMHHGSNIPQSYCGPYFNVELVDPNSWKAFYDVGNEMIITKCGRRTFPYFAVRVTGLIPHMKYSIQVGIEQINPIRWKYMEGKGWSPSKHEVYDTPTNFIEHPDSGKVGEYLEGRTLTFKYIKLTNHQACRDNHFLLKSMHLYNFRLIVAAQMPGNIFCVVYNNSFDQTCFFAVTAYQNKLITRLKIERNPYAKGFLTQDRSRNHRSDSRENRKVRVSESEVDVVFSALNESNTTTDGDFITNPIITDTTTNTIQNTTNDNNNNNNNVTYLDLSDLPLETQLSPQSNSSGNPQLTVRVGKATVNSPQRKNQNRNSSDSKDMQ